MSLKIFYDECDFGKYLDGLTALHNSIVVIAVKDTVGFHIGDDGYKKLASLGLKAFGEGINKRETHWKGYVAVLANNMVIFEELADLDQGVRYDGQINGLRIQAYSSPLHADNVASICLNGNDLCINGRGLNILVYDSNNGIVIDSVAFDTHSPSIKCIRRRINKVDSPTISFLQNEIKALHEMIESQAVFFKRQEEKNSLLLWQCYKKENESLDDAKKRFFRNLPKATGDIRLLQLANMIQLLYVDRICKEHNIEYWLSFGGLLGAVRHGFCIPWDDDLDICMMREQFEKLKSTMNSETELPIYLKDYMVIYDHNLNKIHQVYFKNSSLNCCLDIFIYDYCCGDIEKSKNNHIRLNRELPKEAWKIHCDFYHDRAREIDIVQEKEMESILNLFTDFQTKATAEVGLTNKESAENIIWSLDNFRYPPGVNSSVRVTELFPLEEIKLEGFNFSVPKNAESYCRKMYGDIYTLPDDTRRHKFLDDRGRTEILDVLKNHLSIFNLEGELQNI